MLCPRLAKRPWQTIRQHIEQRRARRAVPLPRRGGRSLFPAGRMALIFRADLVILEGANAPRLGAVGRPLRREAGFVFSGGALYWGR